MQIKSVVVYFENGVQRSIKGEIQHEDELFLTILDSHGTRIRIRRIDLIKIVEKVEGKRNDPTTV